jgi:carbon storage regulator
MAAADARTKPDDTMARSRAMMPHGGRRGKQRQGKDLKMKSFGIRRLACLIATAGAAGLGAGAAVAQTVLATNNAVIREALCVGVDCLNTESFSGFGNDDTLRLKAINLRIHFDDTSTLSGFPANDWRIVINDSISIVVVEIRGDKVRLGVEAPRDVSVHRKEVYDAIKSFGLVQDVESSDRVENAGESA